jgi:TRAP-type C4-dicarboxylate transport system permease small subunit
MKILYTALISLFSFVTLAQSAFAQCTINGQEVPCSDVPGWVWAMPLIFGAIGVFIFVFWLLMLIDVIKNQKEDKAMWVIIVVLLNLLGAIIYYFAEKRGRAK